MIETAVIKRVNALKARQNLAQLVEEVYCKGDQYIIERAGKPMAAVVPLWQLEDRGKRRERIFGMLQEIWQATAKVKSAVVERDVEFAVRVVRAKASRKKVDSGRP